LIDEPEQHLHPSAQESIAAWCAEQARDHAAVVVATHSPAFWRLPSHRARVVELVHRSGKTEARSRSFITSTDDPVSTARRISDDLGMGSQSLFGLIRGVLLVEGEWDRRVLLHFYASDVEAAGALVLPVGGIRHAVAVATVNLVAALERPIVVLFDAVQNSRLDDPQTPEERTAAEIRNRLSGVHVVTCDIPDVICALPDAAVRRAIPDAAFPGWKTLIAQFGAIGKEHGFKNWALRKMPDGLRDQQIFIPQVLGRSLPGELASPPFHSAVMEALSHINDRAS
jgi:hypothetical protein